MTVNFTDIIRSAWTRITASTLVKSAGIYSISRVVNAAVPFLLMPLLTRYLSPTDYGIAAMFYVLLGIISPFVGLNIHGAVGLRYFDKLEMNLPRYIGNCFWLLIISSSAVSTIIWFFSTPIASITRFPSTWLWAVISFAVGQSIILLLMTLWQVRNRPVKFSVFQNLQTILNMGLSIVFVVVLERGWQGRLEAEMITVGAFTLVAFVLLNRSGSIDLTLDLERMRHALKFGVPLIPHALGAILIAQADRIFISNMVSVTETGIYTVGLQIAMIIELFSSSFHIAYVPWLYKTLSKNDSAVKTRVVKATYLYFFLILATAMVLSLLTPWLLGFFVDKAFSSAHIYTFWLALGFAFGGMYYMVTGYIFFVGKTHILAWVTFFTALCNIILNYVLIKVNGAVGAAQATAISLCVSFILTWALSARVYPMPWNLRKPA